MQPQPFLVLGDRDRARMVQWGQACADAWAARWLARGGAAPGVAWHDPPQPDTWLVADAGEGQTVAVGYTDEWLGELGMLLAGEDRAQPGPSELTCEIARTALRELVLCLCGGAQTQVQWRGDVPAQTGPGSGFVTLACRFSDDSPALTLLAWPQHAASLIRTPARVAHSDRLMPTSRALESRPVRVDALVGSAELALAELASLAPGDVLVLDRRLEQPALLVLGSEPAFAAGYLCASGGQRALEVVPLQSN
jgi:hypothetical protein